MKDITDTAMSASYIDLHLEINKEGRLRTKLYDKRDDFNLHVATFQQHLHMEYIYHSWSDIPEFVVHIMVALIEGCC
jgi:hypothetical protein